MSDSTQIRYTANNFSRKLLKGLETSELEDK